jgi:hypothetical protein
MTLKSKQDSQKPFSPTETHMTPATLSQAPDAVKKREMVLTNKSAFVYDSGRFFVPRHESRMPVKYRDSRVSLVSAAKIIGCAASRASFFTVPALLYVRRRGGRSRGLSCRNRVRLAF